MIGRRGGNLKGPARLPESSMPEEIQNYTIVSVGTPFTANKSHATEAFVAYLMSPPAIAVLMPTTRPRASASGPPEFPGARRTAARIHCCRPIPA